MYDESMGFFGKHISMIYRFEQMYYDKALQNYHIGGGQQFFLIVIDRHPGINQWELSKVIAMDKGTTAKAVKKLEEEGYITRIPLAGDKRVKQLYITKKAEPLLLEMQKLRQRWRDIVMEGMTLEEISNMEKMVYYAAQRALQYTRKKCIGEKEVGGGHHE